MEREKKRGLSAFIVRKGGQKRKAGKRRQKQQMAGQDRGRCLRTKDQESK